MDEHKKQKTLKVRRPYTPPRVLEDQEFEREALATCLKQNSGSCGIKAAASS